MDQTYMKQKPVLPLVVSMALPMTLSMLVNSLYNIVDSIFIAKISDNAMTALSLVYPIQNLITAITVGFAIGTNAVISIHLGAGNKKRSRPCCLTWHIIKCISRTTSYDCLSNLYSPFFGAVYS